MYKENHDMNKIYFFYALVLIALHAIFYTIGVDKQLRRDLLKHNRLKYNIYKYVIWVLNISLIFYLRYCIVEQFK